MAASSSSTDTGHHVFLQTPQSAEFESTTDAQGGVETAVANRYVPFKSPCEQSKRDCLGPGVYAEISGDGFERVVQVSEESKDEEVHSGPIRPLTRPGEVKVAGGHKDEVENTLGELLKLRTMLQERSESDGAGLIDLCD
uniref:Uncharacterized protein n=1 Tax=Noctiluca scintillans TaxID=2966 RepID=A0A7S0ZM16_NOCSC|mmetsp:Transcript_10627/g.29433  ORF Transcript_10627/g.29433 Transcript_10627/m.29433 type:complete len:140 (+) Transcript_10627:2-421(+)